MEKGSVWVDGRYGLYKGHYGVQCFDVYKMDQCVLAGEMVGSKGGLYTPLAEGRLGWESFDYPKGNLLQAIDFIRSRLSLKYVLGPGNYTMVKNDKLIYSFKYTTLSAIISHDVVK